MKCKTCNADLPPKKPRGRKKLYCSKACDPNAYKPKGAGLPNCQICGSSLENVGTPGRPKRNCSKKCRIKARSIKLLKPKDIRSCLNCEKVYETALPHKTYCLNECRYIRQKQSSVTKYQLEILTKYPNRLRTAPCGWCGEDRTFEIGKSVVNAFHPKCTLEAQRARYRIKTVKRQKHKNPNRISHEQVVQEYGDVCHICQEPIDMNLPRTNRLGLTVDHVIPLSKGGTDTMENLRPAHWICNNRKSNKPLEKVIA